ncbi:MAG TPA: thiamine pyrophosphate-binding protein [Albitalea sp.]
MSTTSTHSGTQIAAVQLTEYLERVGVEAIWGMCGHSLVQMLDALDRSRIRFVSCRHEQLAAHVADGYARVSGKTGVVMTHVGPGLTNAITGIATASLDCIPMVVITGNVQSYCHGRGPHQEVNLHADNDQIELCRPICKRVYRVGRAEDLPRVMERAFHLAQSGRPGVVLVDVPMDFFSAELPVGAFSRTPGPLVKPSIDVATARRIAEALARAERPVIVAGGGVHLARASAELQALAEALEVPVAHSLMGKGCLPDGHPLLLGTTGYWGQPVANELCRNADLILAVATRFSETDSSSWDPTFTFDIPKTRLIQIDIDDSEIGRNYPAELGVVADAKQALATIAEQARGLKHAERKGLRARIADGLATFASNWTAQRASDEFPMRPERVLADVRRALPRDGFIVTDVGWNKNGVGQQFAIHEPGTMIAPGGMATMGFGHAAVLGVKMAAPQRAAVALIGDGCFSSNMSVLAMAVEADVPVVWVVMDNASYGVISGIEKRHLGNTHGCMFEANGEPYFIDYAAVANACGARGVKIESAGQLTGALQEALASGKPTLIQVPVQLVPTPTTGHWDINAIFRKPAA